MFVRSAFIPSAAQVINRNFATATLKESAVEKLFFTIFGTDTKEFPDLFQEISPEVKERAKPFTATAQAWFSDFWPDVKRDPLHRELVMSDLRFDKDKKPWTRNQISIAQCVLVLKACDLAKFTFDDMSEQEKAFEM